MTAGRQGLLEQGQRRSIRQSRRTVLRDYGPEEAASSRRRAVGTAGPFQGLRADLEQRTPPTIPPGPQYLQGTTGLDGSAGGLCRSAPRQADDTTTRTFLERADESVRCSGFWAKLLHADQPTELGPGSQRPLAETFLVM